jgi:hypothetical protein
MTRDPANFREYAATLSCFMLIMAAILLVFSLIYVPVYTGKTVSIPEAASQFFFGLVMAAIGYLIGKQTTGSPAPAASIAIAAPPAGDGPNTTTATVTTNDTATGKAA